MVALSGVCGLLRRPWAWVLTTVFLLVAFSDKVMENAMTWHHLWTFVGYPPHVYRLTSTFFVGGCFYLFRAWIRFKLLYAGICAVVLMLVIIFVPTKLEIPLTLFGGYLLFYVAQMPMPFLTRLEKLPDISYGIYLYGWPVESLWIWYRRSSPWVAFVVSSLICFALGWLSWHYVERPMLKLKKRATAPLPSP
jgi:peptidoglycan/LPS O-acetylase OafA/YrhL